VCLERVAPLCSQEKGEGKPMTMTVKVMMLVGLAFVLAYPAAGYLETNDSFEIQGAAAADAAGWSRGGGMWREQWGGENSTWHVAVDGWTADGTGYMEQYINCDSNLSYYFRIRALREENFTNANVDVVLRYFPPGSDWTLLQAYTNTISMSLTSWTWTTFEAGGAAPDGAGKAQMRLFYSDSNNAAASFRAMRFDHASLYTGGKNYLTNEIVDEFSYSPTVTNASSWTWQDLAGNDRGNGFTNAWQNLWGPIYVAPGSFGVVSNYPTPQGHKMHIGSAGGGILRGISPVTSGQIYAAAYFNHNNEANGNWTGISFYNDGVERAFIGPNSGGMGQTKMLMSLDSFGGTLTQGDYQFNGAIGEDYVIFAKYDFATRQLAGHAYYKTDTIPWDDEPDWNVTATLTAGRITEVDAIRLAAGGGASNPGDV